MRINNKRLVSVVSILDNQVVQSKSFNNYLPIGNPEITIENLARWGSDEILIQCFNQTKKNIGPNIKLLKKISINKNATPLIYCGGIKNEQHALQAIKNGADRVVVGYSFFDKFDYNLLDRISNEIGRQSLILSLPIIYKKNKLFIYNYVSKKIIDINKTNFFKLKKFVSEILITDVINEGHYDSFNLKIFKLLKINIPCIFFGGINSKRKINLVFKQKMTSAIGIGNFLSFKEHSYQNLSKNSQIFLRKPYYEKNK